LRVRNQFEAYILDTEIDFKTYLQQVHLFLNGERDYSRIYGDTGPIVYPAGFLYVYTFFDFLTSGGSQIMMAQFVFLILQIVTVGIMIRLYKLCGLPLLPILMLSFSKRIHSIYTLRLFNDPIAMLPLYVSILLLTKRKWLLSCICYGVALSIKMNVLLFLPGYCLIFYQTLGAYQTLGYLATILSSQVLMIVIFIALRWF
jgi:alpha-1,3-mannosyltransferase